MGLIRNVWGALDPRQRLIAVLAMLAIGATVWGLVQAIRTPSMETLYGGLDSRAAAEVATAVQAMGVRVETQGGSILVPAGERERVRMALAAARLPRNGPEGYELLDGLDGFGTTSEMFAATYWRAKEGELARTILATPGVRTARVHIANPSGRPFQRTARPSASVTVTTGHGVLDTGQAEAIRFLVASAVPGLEPQAVSVIDAAHGAILRMGEAAGGDDGQRSGSNREQQLRAEIERLLAARVGDGKAIVSVAVETTLESETTRERIIDPNSRVAISTDSREVEETGTGGVGGAATVASNLPVDGGGAEAETTRARTETEERVNFEISETTRERVRRAGDIRRITVAVLVDGIHTLMPNGERVWTPRTEAEIGQLRDLVRSAIGFDETRGDRVTVETLEFAERPVQGTLAEAGVTDFVSRHIMSIIQIVALAAVAVGLGVFVLRPLLRAAEANAGAVADRGIGGMAFIDEFDTSADRPQDNLTLLRNAFEEQRTDSAGVLRSWLERDAQDGTETAGEERA